MIIKKQISQKKSKPSLKNKTTSELIKIIYSNHYLVKSLRLKIKQLKPVKSKTKKENNVQSNK